MIWGEILAKIETENIERNKKMKRVLFFLLMIFVSFGVIADCEIQAKDHDCFTIFAKVLFFPRFLS
ncbi:protein [Escherichia coli]|nr:protein [Escherichia coli]